MLVYNILHLNENFKELALFCLLDAAVLLALSKAFPKESHVLHSANEQAVPQQIVSI